MPVPIKPVVNMSKTENNYMSDYSFLVDCLAPAPQVNKKKQVVASNKDADLLLDLWVRGEKSGETIKVNSKITSRELMRLKTMGFVVGDLELIKFTRKGKTVITTMVLNEASEFEKNKKYKDYSEILANMSKRGKPGYRIPKFATNNSNNIRL